MKEDIKGWIEKYYLANISHLPLPPPWVRLTHRLVSLAGSSRLPDPIFLFPPNQVGKGRCLRDFVYPKDLKVTWSGRLALVCQGYISTIMIHNNINAMFLVFIVTYKIKYNIVNMCLYAIYILVLLTYKFIECNKMYTICCLFSWAIISCF